MSRSCKTPRPNLYLVGFMGTGKTTVGRTLARRLRMEFIDSDHVIEEQAGQPIPEIFAEKGEAHFRGLERAFIESGHPASGCIVACGGGLVTQPGMAEALRARGVVVCLFASPKTILKRTSSNSNRPLLNVPDPEGRIRELLAQREPAYLNAGTCIYTDERPFADVISHLERFYRRAANEYARKH
ncbi:shikimate kinase [Ruficoccus amylovorans]|uniref:Shikimate kinase n=1 Tax=Ruficoccus amylovorans TaxID=1804625 RepID=A0A842HK52_9BACT|nr:shikimate kinase [Ruficoccus amylovorans]MBC2596044.1 shikimate kinase [Ruficoccus amylovorans]